MTELIQQRVASVCLFLLLLIVSATTSAASYCFSNRTSAIDTCYESLRPILENLRLTGLPGSKEDVDRLCDAFQRGMKCVDDYAKVCLNKKQRATLEQTVLGARLTITNLCDDLEFQKEYLKHTPCYEALREEWDRCSLLMKKAVEAVEADKQMKLHTNYTQYERLKELCRAKYQFRVCTEEVAERKCSGEAAVVLREIAESLTRSMLTGKCREIEPTSMQDSLKPPAQTSLAQRTLGSVFLLLLSMTALP